MTKKEIAQLIGYEEKEVHKAFSLAAKENANIQAKNNHSSVIRIVDYTLEETRFAMKFFSTCTPMMMTYIEENFFERKSGYEDRRKAKVKLPKNIKDFIYYYKHNHSKIKCCVVCKYLIARRIDKIGCGYYPYCTLKGRFLYNMKPKVDVYFWSCRNYEFSKKPPFIFLKGSMPQKLNVYGFDRTNSSTLGVWNKKFTSKSEFENGEINLLGYCSYESQE